MDFQCPHLNGDRITNYTHQNAMNLMPSCGEGPRCEYSQNLYCQMGYTPT